MIIIDNGESIGRSGRSLPNIYTRVRKEIWGYAADEFKYCTTMIAETYKGIRPVHIPLVPIIWKTYYLEITC
jgi:hypothetical protein